MRKYDCIGDVRGLGLMMGVEFVTDRVFEQTSSRAFGDRVEVALVSIAGYYSRGAGTNTIRWSPPLILTAGKTSTVAVEIFDEAIAASI